MISNLHSILSGKWYMHEAYADANLPILIGILTRGGEVKSAAPQEILTKSTKSFLNNGSSETNKGSVAIISIKNPIYKHDQECGPRGTKTISKILTQLENDDSIAGVVFDIDSGGGQAYGTPLVYEQILTYSKPTVTYTDGLMCSAAYYLGSASKHIVANKRAEDIGSLGAYAQILDLEGMYEMQGAKVHTMYATKSKDKNSTYREVLKGNYKPYITQELDPLVNTFIEDVKAARPNIKEEVFGGATYDGVKAVELGLADENGDLQTAIDKVYELAEPKKENTSQVNNQQSLNKSISMSKKLTMLLTVLGVASLASTEEKGSYLNEEQLNSIEDALSKTATVSQADLDKVEKDRDSLQEKLTASENKNTTIETALTTALKEAELEAGKDNEASIKVLQDRIAELGAKDGSVITKVTTDHKKQTEHISYLDGAAGHNQLADSLHN